MQEAHVQAGDRPVEHGHVLGLLQLVRRPDPPQLDMVRAGHEDRRCGDPVHGHVARVPDDEPEPVQYPPADVHVAVPGRVDAGRRGRTGDGVVVEVDRHAVGPERQPVAGAGEVVVQLDRLGEDVATVDMVVLVVLVLSPGGRERAGLRWTGRAGDEPGGDGDNGERADDGDDHVLLNARAGRRLFVGSDWPRPCGVSGRMLIFHATYLSPVRKVHGRSGR
jgi:hypothetical protein